MPASLAKPNIHHVVYFAASCFSLWFVSTWLSREECSRLEINAKLSCLHNMQVATTFHLETIHILNSINRFVHSKHYSNCMSTYFLTMSVGFARKKFNHRVSASVRFSQQELQQLRGVGVRFCCSYALLSYFIPYELPASNKNPPFPFSVYCHAFTNYTCEHFWRIGYSRRYQCHVKIGPPFWSPQGPKIF